MSYIRFPSSIPTFPTLASLPPVAIDGDAAITLDTDTLYIFNLATVTWIAVGGGGGSGTVTSVGLALPNIFTISGSPVTTTGTLTGTLATQTANKIWAGPTTGSAAAPTFRSLVSADLPFAIGDLTDVGTDGITITDGTGAVIGSGTSIAQHVADASHNGYLSSADWSTFNSKGAGSVTSVAMTVPGTIYSVAGSPITTSGTLALSLLTQVKNLVFAGPATGADAAPTFRTLVGADLPNPAASTLGGVNSKASVSHNFLTQIGTDGSVSQAQPAFSDISGTATGAQLPLPAVATLGGVFSKAVVTSNFLTGISSVDGGVSQAQPAFTDISGTATNAQLPSTISTKTFDNSNTYTAKANAFTIQDPSDTTKQAQFVASTIATGTTRTFTFPNNSGTLAVASNTLTFTNKTMDGGSNTFTNIPVAALNSGTGASSTTFWRGDATWATPTASAALTTGQIGYGVASVLGGSTAYTIDDTNKRIVLNAGNSLASAIQFLQGTLTGTTATDGSIIGLTDAGDGTLNIKNQESGSGAGGDILLNSGIGGGSSAIYFKNAANSASSVSTSNGWRLLSQNATNELDINNNGIITTGKLAITSDGSSPTAQLHIVQAGSTSANTAPIKLTSGSLNTTAVVGQMEYNGSHYQTKVGPVRYGLGGTLTEGFADAGNTTTSETDIYTYTTLANTLDVNGHSVHAKYAGVVVNSSSTKQLRVYFGGTLVYDSGAMVTTAAANWVVEVICIRVSSTVVRCAVNYNASSGLSVISDAGYTEVTGLTLSSTNVVKITGTAAGAGAATNDIVGKLNKVTFEANN